MNILALDTACEVLSAALATDTGVWYIEADAGIRHSELLMECVDGLCKNAGLLPEHLNMAACMKGPGSFTGLRIGFSAAKGIALALGIPLVTVPTLDCLAYPHSIWPGIVIPALDAKKGCFFTALYRGGKRLTEFMDASPETIAGELIKHSGSPPYQPVVLTGTGAELLYSRLAGLIPAAHISIDPEFRRGKARELFYFLKADIIEDTGDKNSGPVYLRKSDAELNY